MQWFVSTKKREVISWNREGKNPNRRHTETPAMPSMPMCDTGRSKSALCLRIATPLAAIAKTAKRIVTIAVVRVILSKPGRERKVTDVLNTIAAFFLCACVMREKLHKAEKRLTMRHVHAPMMSIGAGPRSSPDSSSAVRLPARRVRSRKI